MPLTLPKIRITKIEKNNKDQNNKAVHLKAAHKIIDGTNDDFDDQSEKFHSEYVNMIGRCFSADRVKLEDPATTKDVINIAAESVIRGVTTGSQLTVERHLFFNRLIRKIVDSDGRIKCSFCPQRTAVKYTGRIDSQPAFSHVEMHMRKPLYRCKVCADQLRTRSLMSVHLKTEHALGLVKNYECISDEFHEEILEMLSKCYGAKD